MQLRKNKNKGMTVVEILVASLILSVVLLGYVSIQISSSFNTEYANKSNSIMTSVNDFSNIFSNSIVNESSDDDRNEIIGFYQNANWDNNNYDPLIQQCISTSQIDDVNYCDKELMIQYMVMLFKSSVYENVPDAEFKFENCDNTSNMCLIVGWSDADLTEAECRISTGFCLLVEIPK